MDPASAFHRVSSGGAISNTAPVTEKPFHYTYLKEFRVEQCRAFLQHKCNQHRPFTCFQWHFANQRRRRPVKRRDGTFNYSPDVYCTFYDETSGICPNGDECPYLHRTAGDTERRYHLRYYKTSTCVYETDSRGYCVKNGPHCAFAHGPHDLRPPVYDIREFQAGGDDEDRLVSPLVGSLERERGVLVDDPRWQESSFVLTYYKTEPCKRPPRLCRQGYACPFYHNNKDRRRSPKNFKYRSTPCPNVKLNDEWGDPAYCDQGHNCCYCHTRTEQQFHPEIYKSTKCNDVQQTGYCPRGPFCAFAHDEKELTAPRELTNEPMVTTPSPVLTGSSLVDSDSHHFPFHAVHQQTTSATPISSSPHNRSLPQPIGHPPERTGSSLSEGAFQRAPGAEVKSRSFEEEGQTYIRKQIQVIEGDTSLDETERTRRKQNLLRLSLGSGGPGMSPEALQSHSLPSSVSDALEAMVGGGLDDLTLEDIDPSSLAEEQQQQQSELIGASILGQSPIAQSFMQSFPPQVSSTSYPYSTPLGPLSPYGTSGQQGFAATVQHQQQAAMATGASQRYSIITQTRPGGLGSPTKPSPMMQAAMGSPREKTEVATLREELRQAKTQLATWQEAWKQAKHAADLWKKEAEDAHLAARHATRRAEELDSKVKSLQMQGPVRMLAESADISKMSLSELEQVQAQMRKDIERIDTSRRHRVTALCMLCKEFPRCIHTQPCNHCVLCENCAEKMGDDAKCPYCNEPITKRTTVLLPF